MSNKTWMTLGELVHRLWRWCLGTRASAFTLCAALTAIGAAWYHDPSRPMAVMAAPLAIPVFALFLILLGVAGMLGDEFAEWAMRKLVKQPDPDNAAHQALAFALSCVGIILGLAVALFGDLPA